MGGLTLEIISESHANLMDGISEALMSTAAGLIIAITTLLANNIFKMLRTSEMEILQEAALEIEEKFKSQITSAQCQ
jgi:biopolymer transport protein ExbB/TolQ